MNIINCRSATDPGRIDLHMHSVFSDGTDSPPGIIGKVRDAGISVFSLTDHDAVKGCESIIECLSSDDPRFITGAEFSCRDDDGRYHILGYGFDPEAGSISDIVGIGHRFRMKKITARLEFIKNEFGFDFPEEEKTRLISMLNPGKPHIAELMVKYGYAENVIQAFEYIDRLRFHSEYLRPEQAIKGVIDGGGIPVLAHPAFGNGSQHIVGDELKNRIVRLTDFGLRGVEAFYSGFDEKLTSEILGYAGMYDLYVTAGSDYHGTTKKVSIGDTGCLAELDPPEGLLRFLRDVNEAQRGG